MVTKEITQARIRANGNYRRWNAHTLASEHIRYVNRSPVRCVIDHAEELANDPDRLTSEFLIDLVFSIEPKQ